MAVSERYIIHNAVATSIVRMMFDAMSDKKRTQYDEACSRVLYLTSHYGMSWYTLSTYKEGWYFECGGCRTQYCAWGFDNDGEIVIGRKPNESKLHFIWSHSFSDNPIDMVKLQKGEKQYSEKYFR